VVDQRSDGWAQKGDVRVEDFDRRKRALCEELLYEVEHLLTIPEILLDVGEVRGKELGPERILRSEDVGTLIGWGIRGLGKNRRGEA